MELKPIRKIPSRNIEILAETSEVVLCKRNFNDGYTLHGSDHEYVTWLKGRGTENSFTLGHYFNHDLEEAFKDFLHRASREIGRDYVAVPKQSLKFFIEKTTDVLNQCELDEEDNHPSDILYPEEFTELNEAIKALTVDIYKGSCEPPTLSMGTSLIEGDETNEGD